MLKLTCVPLVGIFPCDLKRRWGGNVEVGTVHFVDVGFHATKLEFDGN
jgi:hypothetical protein